MMCNETTTLKTAELLIENGADANAKARGAGGIERARGVVADATFFGAGLVSGPRLSMGLTRAAARLWGLRGKE